jgi:integrase
MAGLADGDPAEVERASHSEVLLELKLVGVADGPGNRRFWYPARVAADLPDAGYHALRHYCATTLLRRPVSVAAVARFLGNSPATIQRHYAHWIADDDDLIRSELDAALADTFDNGDNDETSGELKWRGSGADSPAMGL